MIATDLHEELIIAGFGGQGILLIGRLLAQTVMQTGREVTFMPSYGAEVRGGTANCMVIMAGEPIASPVVSNPDSLIVMNNASLERFCPKLKTNGLLVVNISLVDVIPQRSDIELLSVPADDIAVELESPKSANMVALGAYLRKRGMIDVEETAQCLGEVLAERYHKMIPVNTQALKRGAEFVQKRYV